jgi:hypothetical protein
MQEARFPTRSSRLLSMAAALLLIALPLVAPAARAQSDSTKQSSSSKVSGANHLYDKFQIDMSVANVLIGPNLRVDNEDGSQGTDVSTGDILGIERNGFEARLALRWRPGHRHELELGYLMVNRNGEKRLTEDIDFRDTTFTAGLKVNTSLGASDAFLAYRFAFTAKEKTQIGAQLGLGAIFFTTEINALAGVTNGNDTLSTSFTAGGSITGPTAALGLYGRFRLGEKWYLEANAGGVGATVENITVTLLDVGADARYFINDRFGLEAGYGLTQIKIKIDKEGSGGLFDPTIQGNIKYPFQNFRVGVVAAFQ